MNRQLVQFVLAFGRALFVVLNLLPEFLLNAEELTGRLFVVLLAFFSNLLYHLALERFFFEVLFQSRDGAVLALA